MNEPFLTFSLGTQRYALAIEEVVEVAAMVELVQVAGMPPEVIGVANRHGSVLPIIDLRTALRQESPRLTMSTLFIVGAVDEHCAGLVVDEVHQVEYLNTEEAAARPLGERFIRAIVPHRGELIQVMTLPPLLAKVLPASMNAVEGTGW